MDTKQQLDDIQKAIDAIRENLGLNQYELPDFVPDWKYAPEDAKYAVMDANGEWWYWSGMPEIRRIDWGSGKFIVIDLIGKCTNATRLHPDYWKQSLQERPIALDVTKAHNELVENIAINELKNFANKAIEVHQEYSNYIHLLPEGYEFCTEQDAEKWVKVQLNLDVPKSEQALVGYVWHSPNKINFKHYRPIRRIQYHVAIHESVTAQPDPYQVDWEKAPGGTVAHSYTDTSEGWFEVANIDNNISFSIKAVRSGHLLPSGLDWKQSLRVNPKLK
jgi:hypothetical protein